MTRRNTKIAGWAAGTLCSLGLVGLGVAFVRVGVTEADKWASTLGIFATVLGLALTAYTAAATRRATPQAGPGPAGRVDNTIQGGEFAQSVIQARDLTLGVPPAPASRAAAEGAVTNTITAGTYRGPVVQARDVVRQPADPPAADDGADPSRAG
ncbi:hypothetical protein [Micromonospora antibiotica]|uniref:Holin n=1 Tax=Micromonospora antibiotica TaxID=2807623 RepID=A0ABS3VGL1_9ACTN|nr:hypothetical protein [Micromonospora antibiotica]MBO4164732.1 hypothetical protein [Micromonospora antibiotica]